MMKKKKAKILKKVPNLILVVTNQIITEEAD